MDENEPQDVKDFPLFESDDVEYYTYTIITEKAEKANDENIFVNKDNVCPVKIKVEEEEEITSTTNMQVKIEPYDYSEDMIDISQNRLKEQEASPDTTKCLEIDTGKNYHNFLKL